jgi:hypothetical protein
MALKARTSDAGRQAQRTSLSASEAAAASMTATLLAGAVTGAVAQARDATPGAADRTQHPARGGDGPGVEATSPSQTGQAGAAAPIAAVPVAEKAAPETTRADATGESRGETVSPGSGPGGASHARASDGAAIDDGRSVADGGLPAAEAADAVQAFPATAASARTDGAGSPDASATDATSRPDAPAEAWRPASITDQTADLRETVEEMMSGAARDIAAQATSLESAVTRLGDAISARIDATADALLADTKALTDTIAAIPASVLGANEQETDRPGDILPQIMATIEAAAAPLVNPVVALPSQPEALAANTIDLSKTVDDIAQAATAPLADAATSVDASDFGEAANAFKIGFAGQSYAEVGDLQDGAGLHHPNLLQGLL